MKKIFTVILLWFFITNMSNAQTANCSSNVVYSIAFGGDEITASMIDSGSSNYDSLTISPQYIYCSDVGSTIPVVLTAHLNGNTSTCTTQVQVEDKLDPIVLCEANNILLPLDGNGMATLTVDMALDTAYDNCPQGLTYNLSQTQFDATSNPIELVELTVADAQGNDASCFVQIEIPNTNNIVLVGLDTAFIRLPNNGTKEIFASDVLVHGPLLGWDVELSIEDENSTVVPNNIIDVSHMGKVLTYVVEDLNSSNSAWGHIKVLNEFELDCDAFHVCDSLPWTAPVTVCGEHILDDGIEWPADITINSCYFSPYYLTNFAPVNSWNAKPRVNSDCEYIDVAHSDEVFTYPADDFIKVIRNWIVVRWAPFSTHRYSQVITVDMTDCLTSVNVTSMDRVGIEGVRIAENIYTNVIGAGELVHTKQNNIVAKKESTIDAGVDVHDVVKVLEHIEGVKELTDLQKLAADLSGNEVIDMNDIQGIIELFNGEVELSTIEEMNFIGSKDLDPKSLGKGIAAGDYYGGPVDVIAIKSGDVTGDFANYGEESSTTTIEKHDIYIKDLLLNAGEAYELPVLNDGGSNFVGFQMDIYVDFTKVDLVEINSDVFPGFAAENYRIINNEFVRINWVASNALISSGGLNVELNEALIDIKLQAKENGILSNVLALDNQSRNTLAKSNNNTRFEFVLNWIDRIFLSTIDPEGLNRNVQLSPIPASTVVGIKINNDNGQTYELSVFNTTGSKIWTGEIRNEVSLSVDEWDSGIYFVEIRNGRGFTHRSIFSVVKN